MVINEMAVKTVSVCFYEELLALIEEVKTNRNDSSFSNVVRFLCMKGLGTMSYLTPAQKKALGVD